MLERRNLVFFHAKAHDLDFVIVHYYGNRWNLGDYFLGSTKKAICLALMILTTVSPIWKKVSDMLLSSYRFCHIVRIDIFGYH